MSDNTTVNQDFKEQFEKAAPVIDKMKIGKSPLEIINVVDEKKWAIVMGQHRVTDWMNSEEEVKEYLENEWLDLNFRLIAIMLEVYQKTQNE